MYNIDHEKLAEAKTRIATALTIVTVAGSPAAINPRSGVLEALNKLRSVCDLLDQIAGGISTVPDNEQPAPPAASPLTVSDARVAWERAAADSRTLQKSITYNGLSAATKDDVHNIVALYMENFIQHLEMGKEP